jgi:hypothetical protein
MLGGAQTTFHEAGNLASAAHYCPVNVANKAAQSVAKMLKRQVAYQENSKLCYRSSIALAVMQQSVSWSN